MSLGAFVCIFGGAFIGMYLRRRLPGHHLDADTKDVVRLGGGFISTIAALVLGLLIASANSTFEAQSGQVKQLIANTILLDNVLALYGPEAGSMRASLRRSIPIMTDRIWRENSSDSGKETAFEAGTAGLALGQEILALSPQTETQRALKAMALSATDDIAKARFLLFAKAGSLPMPFLVVLVSWLTILFASFSLFSNSNATAITALCVFAVSASASIFLILELSTPFSGLMQIPSEALRNALAPLHP